MFCLLGFVSVIMIVQQTKQNAVSYGVLSVNAARFRRCAFASHCTLCYALPVFVAVCLHRVVLYVMISSNSFRPVLKPRSHLIQTLFKPFPNPLQTPFEALAKHPPTSFQTLFGPRLESYYVYMYKYIYIYMYIYRYICSTPFEP